MCAALRNKKRAKFIYWENDKTFLYVSLNNLTINMVAV